MVESTPNGESQRMNSRKPRKVWIPVVDALRAIEEVEDAGGGRFTEINRSKFPKSNSEKRNNVTMERRNEPSKKRWQSIDSLLKQHSDEEIGEMSDPRISNGLTGEGPLVPRKVHKLRTSFVETAKDDLKKQHGK